MAAGGYKEFVAGETLDQDEINDYLMQGMLVFAGTAARGSAIGTPVEGQFTYLKDSDTVEFYDSTQWVPFASGVGAAVVSGTTGSPTVGTVSSGGTTFNVYSFTGDGSITFSDSGLVDLLILGGGASGGDGGSQCSGGGGGAGQLLELSNHYVSAGTVTVTVGAGGAGVAGSQHGLIGGPSVFGQIDVASGGGGGGAQEIGDNGASGGGGSSRAVTGVTKIGGYSVVEFNGNNGGSSFGHTTVSLRAAGGGGGAGAVGANAASSAGGAGGAGVSSSITGTSLFYGGGGGGGVQSGTPGAGGSSIGGGGGLGNGDIGDSASPANRGSGGGGGNDNTSGSGSSGVVIVRVAV